MLVLVLGLVVAVGVTIEHRRPPGHEVTSALGKGAGSREPAPHQATGSRSASARLPRNQGRPGARGEGSAPAGGTTAEPHHPRPTVRSRAPRPDAQQAKAARRRHTARPAVSSSTPAQKPSPATVSPSAVPATTRPAITEPSTTVPASSLPESTVPASTAHRPPNRQPGTRRRSHSDRSGPCRNGTTVRRPRPRPSRPPRPSQPAHAPRR